jgi:hypothetical protein
MVIIIGWKVPRCQLGKWEIITFSGRHSGPLNENDDLMVLSDYIITVQVVEFCTQLVLFMTGTSFFLSETTALLKSLFPPVSP